MMDMYTAHLVGRELDKERLQQAERARTVRSLKTRIDGTGHTVPRKSRTASAGSAPRGRNDQKRPKRSRLRFKRPVD